MPLIDTHCHLDAEGFRQDLDEVIRCALDQGLKKMVTIGTDVSSSRAAILLASRYSSVFPAAGIHPNYVQNASASDWEQIETLACLPEVVGVGETGLDRYWESAPLELQRDYFRRHMTLARQVGKPFIVHCREAEAEVLEELRREFTNGALHGVMHAFSGSAAMAEECVQMGMHISIAGMVTFRKNEALREVAKGVPLSRLLVETDAPYLAPQPNRGKRNQPAWVKFTAECLAEVHNITFEDFSLATTRNATSFFRFPDKGIALDPVSSCQSDQN